MRQVKWFERKFDFDYQQNIFPSIVERLAGTPIRLAHKIAGISSQTAILKPDNAWSIAENIGHLIDLEPLWQGRLQDILNGETYLRPTDLNNTKTDQANHNARSLRDLADEFAESRSETIQKLAQLTEREVFQSALHPRLHTPMRTMDLFLFVAEHDDHHLARMTELAGLSS
jgi:uncharacterized damage-inducible protein DinB